jgi:hypothetical protein
MAPHNHCSGFNRYHLFGAIVPIAAALAPFALSGVFPKDMPQWMRCLATGAITFVWCYIAFGLPVLRETKHSLGKAMLLGLLASEMCVFSSPHGAPSLTLIAFFVFMYSYGTGEVEPGLHWLSSCSV